MKIKSLELVEELQAATRQLILETGYLKTEERKLLTLQPAPGKWSVAQVIAHLNSYGRYYLPAIEKSMRESSFPAAAWFNSGWLGDYFTRIMQPGKNGAITNKMKAPKDHRPALIIDSEAVITEFLEQQHHLLHLLEWAKEKDLGRMRTPISIAKFIRIKTGDVFRFLIAHEQRHFVQIQNALAMIKGVTGKLQEVHPAA